MAHGFLCVVGASFLFGLVPTANKCVMLSGVRAECNTFLTQLTICAVAMLLAKLSGQNLKIDKKDARHLFFVGATGMGITTYLVTSASVYIPVGLATVLHFLYPTVVSLVMVAVYGQRLTKRKGTAIVCSIAGMVLISNVTSSGSVHFAGILLALVSSLTYSFYVISNEKGSTNEIPPIVCLAYSALGSTVLFGVLCVSQGMLTMPVGLDANIAQFCVSGLGSLCAFYLIVRGVRMIGASAASFVNILEPVISVVAGAIIFHEYLSASSLLGILLILLSVLFVAMDSSGPAKRKADAGESSPVDK